jgi:hypothetical protein
MLYEGRHYKNRKISNSRRMKSRFAVVYGLEHIENLEGSDTLYAVGTRI